MFTKRKLSTSQYYNSYLFSILPWLTRVTRITWKTLKNIGECHEQKQWNKMAKILFLDKSKVTGQNGSQFEVYKILVIALQLNRRFCWGKRNTKYWCDMRVWLENQIYFHIISSAQSHSTLKPTDDKVKSSSNQKENWVWGSSSKLHFHRNGILRLLLHNNCFLWSF